MAKLVNLCTRAVVGLFKFSGTFDAFLLAVSLFIAFVVERLVTLIVWCWWWWCWWLWRLTKPFSFGCSAVKVLKESLVRIKTVVAHGLVSAVWSTEVFEFGVAFLDTWRKRVVGAKLVYFIDGAVHFFNGRLVFVSASDAERMIASLFATIRLQRLVAFRWVWWHWWFDAAEQFLLCHGAEALLAVFSDTTETFGMIGLDLFTVLLKILVACWCEMCGR